MRVEFFGGKEQRPPRILLPATLMEGPKDSYASVPRAEVALSERDKIAMLKCGLPVNPDLTGSKELEECVTAHGLGEHWETLKDAYYFAKKAHLHQKRDDGTPYYHHCARVMRNAVEEFGVRDVDALKAALLHDVLEDTGVTAAELTARFGPRTSQMARLMTKPDRLPGESYDDRNVRYLKRLEDTGSRDLIALKLSDRFDNVEDTHLMPDHYKISRYVEDTREHYVPLAARYFPGKEEKLTHRLGQIENWMKSW